MNANELIAKVTSLLASFDADLEEKSVVWALERAAAVRNAKDAHRAARKAGDKKALTYTPYLEWFKLAGGKAWYDAFQGSNDAMIEEFARKNYKAVAEHRNEKIAAKLAKIQVSDITDGEVSVSQGGFNGVYFFNGRANRVTINTIIAGGYNIQCKHLRVLVNVK